MEMLLFIAVSMWLGLFATVTTGKSPVPAGTIMTSHFKQVCGSSKSIGLTSNETMYGLSLFECLGSCARSNECSGINFKKAAHGSRCELMLFDVIASCDLVTDDPLSKYYRVPEVRLNNHGKTL